MRKMQKILIGIFFGGIFLGGIGTGVAFVEFASITYAGEKIIGASSMVTKTFDHEFNPKEGKIQVRMYGSVQEPPRADATVPEGVIRYEVTYNERAVEPHLYFDEYEDGEYEDHVYENEVSELSEDAADMEHMGEADAAEQDAAEQDVADPDAADPGSTGEPDSRRKPRVQGMLYLSEGYRGGFGLWMENKDQILADLKNGQIASYRVEEVRSVTIKVNPATLPCVEVGF